MSQKRENQSNGIYLRKKYFGLAVDPIHIGTGGYRIGRVDNTIVREPSTGIPKIPGTTLEGVCRFYSYLKAREEGKSINSECAKGKAKDNREPCGECEICVTFGFTGKDRALQAMALFSDARILFFPVATMIGPVWVTSPMVLRDAGVVNYNDIQSEKFITLLETPDNKLNFGWLLLEKDTSKCIPPELLALKQHLPNVIIERAVIISDELFLQIVNSNLEVRTSVSIDAERGAAEEKALFTFEAIPRGTVFWFEIIYQNPLFYNLNGWKIHMIMKTVESGLKYFEYLGVGGMNSRGFGRLKVMCEYLTLADYLKAVEDILSETNEIGEKEKGKTGDIKKIRREAFYSLKNLKTKLTREISDKKSIIEKIDKILENMSSNNLGGKLKHTNSNNESKEKMEGNNLVESGITKSG